MLRVPFCRCIVAAECSKPAVPWNTLTGITNEAMIPPALLVIELNCFRDHLLSSQLFRNRIIISL